MWRTNASLLAFSVLLFARRAMADNLQCAGTGMNWYMSLVGETPCQTYQKLRQICNTNYTVGVLTINTPPDRCTDQLSACCCNSISFALSMLCLNCQQNIGNGIGIDAGAGAYTDYLESCSNPQLHAIPPNIQTAICNQGIKIEDDLYTNGFANGGWQYILSRDTILADNVTANGNSFTHCPKDTSASSSTTPSSSSTSSSSTTSAASDNLLATKKTLASGAIAGIAVGVVVLLLAAAAAVWLCYYRRRREGLEKPLEGGMREAGGGVLEERLVPHAYSYTDAPTTLAASSSGGPRSVDGTSSAGDSQLLSPRGFHVASSSGDSEASSSVYMGPVGVTGPMSRKWAEANANTAPVARRADSEEPFLEGMEPTGERHHDAGPVPGTGLQRNVSGRLPPAYGEQI